ncbi:MAG: hypothetical protein ACE5DN_05400, partial [Flavobacteriales bacterium]
MKKTATFLVLLAVGIFTEMPASGQAKKNVLFEHYTNDGCNPCAQQNPVFINTILPFNKGRIHVISHHTWWPDANDPMYTYNTSGNDDRINYYGVNGTPTMIMLGNQWSGGPAGVTQSMINEAS